jgi:hypothetical protein
MDIGTILLVAANLVLAGGAVASILFSSIQIRDSRKQIKEAREQARIAQAQAIESEQNLHRPLLVPSGKIELSTLDQPDWGKPLAVTVSNVGPGVATNIRGWLFGSIDFIGTLRTASRYKFALPEPIPHTGTAPCTAPSIQLAFSAEDKIGGYDLAAPSKMSARLTLTYHDIFNNKHASIFDYYVWGGEVRWKSVAFPKVEQDLDELEQAQIRSLQQGGASPKLLPGA